MCNRGRARANALMVATINASSKRGLRMISRRLGDGPCAFMAARPRAPLAGGGLEKVLGLDRTTLQTEAYLDMDLKLGIALGVDRSADFADFEPVNVAQRLGGLFERVAHALVDALVGDADHVDYLVGFVGHGIFS